MKSLAFMLTIAWVLLSACRAPGRPIPITTFPASSTAVLPTPTSSENLVEVTSVVGTAVSPTSTPPSTATTDRRPTIAPTHTPDPAAAQARFLETLQMELNGRQFRSVESKLESPFLIGVYPAATGFSDARGVLFMIQTRLLPQLQTPAITFYQLDTAAIPPHLTPAALFPEIAAQISVVGSSGWGLAASGEALIYLRAEADSYLWVGFVLGYSDFEIALDLETISAPPGLIYQVGDDYWQIDADGEPRLLIANNGRLSLNPTATLALSAEIGDEFVTLFDLPDGRSEVMEVDGRLMISSNRVVWLDEETAVLLLTEERSLSQGTNGFPALLNTTSGTLTKLDFELSNYAQPVVTTEGTIVFGVNEAGELQLWLNGQLSTAPIAALETWPNHFGYPHLSPDGRQVIGTSTSETEPGRVVYLLASMDQPGHSILHAIHAIPTDAAIPWHINWSPDGQFVALAPPSWDFVEAGLWLVNADGSTKILLGLSSDSAVWGSGFSSSVWLDANRVVFSAVWNGQSGLQLYDLSTHKRFWLDTPQFEITLRDRFWLSAEKIIAPVQLIAATK